MGQLEIQCFHNVLIYPISVTRDSIRFDKEMEGLLHRVKNSERVSKVLYGVMYFSPWPYSIPSYRNDMSQYVIYELACRGNKCAQDRSLCLSHILAQLLNEVIR